MNYLILGIVILIGVGLYLYSQNHWIKITQYNIAIPYLATSLKKTKIVHLSDLHIPRHNVSLDKLVAKVREAKPTLILLTGDLVDIRVEEFPKLELSRIASELVAIAPTYAVTGNHDVSSGHLQEWEDILSSQGVRVLIDEAEWLQISNAGLVIMGLSEKENFKLQSTPILSGIELSEGMLEQPKILLAHHPEFFESYHLDQVKSPDITFSGHAHGGQVRVPFIGGLYAPGQGKYPTFSEGIHYHSQLKSKRLVISRGIGNSTFPFRINNRPELVDVTLN